VTHTLKSLSSRGFSAMAKLLVSQALDNMHVDVELSSFCLLCGTLCVDYFLVRFLLETTLQREFPRVPWAFIGIP